MPVITRRIGGINREEKLRLILIPTSQEFSLVWSKGNPPLPVGLSD